MIGWWFNKCLIKSALKDNLGRLATPQHVIAKKTLLMRKDTTQLEATAPARVLCLINFNLMHVFFCGTPPTQEKQSGNTYSNFDWDLHALAQVTAERTESQEVITYLGPGGRVETPEEHDRRLAINAKMRFHRSLSSILFECGAVMGNPVSGVNYQCLSIFKGTAI